MRALGSDLTWTANVVHVFCLLGIQIVDTVRLTIQPNTVTVGGQTGSSTPYPTLTPAEVVMNCQLDTSAERVSYLYLKRKQTQENVFTTFAEMYPEYTEPRLTQNAPQDIKSKSPTLSGSTSGSNARLEARFYVHQMTCQDDAMYQCTINFKRQMSESHEENFNASLTVTVLSRQFTISASRISGTGGGYPQVVQNMSDVDLNTDLELGCNGGIGKTQSTQIEWHWRKGGDLFFTQYPNLGDITQETPSPPTTNQCSYTRRSTLRYRLTGSDWQGVVFRCEVSIPSNSGTFKSYSPEFYINPGYGFDGTSQGISTRTEINVLKLCLYLWLFQHYQRIS